MSDNPITNVLNLLRLLKANRMPDHSMIENVKTWCGGQAQESTMLRFFSYGQDQCEMAIDALAISNLTEEAKLGLLQTAQSLRALFQMDGIHQPVRNQLPQIESAVSSFAILASVYQDTVSPSELDEFNQLISEIESVIALLDRLNQPSTVISLAKKHLHVLVTTLRNVDALGLDAALAAYAELIVRLRTADKTASPEDKQETARIWPKITGWIDKLNKISEASGNGKALLENANHAYQAMIGFAG